MELREDLGTFNLKIMNKAENKDVPRKSHPLITELSSISNYLKTHHKSFVFHILIFRRSSSAAFWLLFQSRAARTC